MSGSESRAYPSWVERNGLARFSKNKDVGLAAFSSLTIAVLSLMEMKATSEHIVLVRMSTI